MKDYFYILGVPTTASISEIKAAYRKLSLKFHPDKNDGDKFFEERFKEINEAYETLTDPEKRTQYDFQRKGYNPHSNTCNQNDSSQESKQKQNTESVRNFPTILFFKSNKTEIEKGNTIHVSWDTLDGKSVFIDKIGEVSTLGSKEIKINNFNSDGVCVISITVSNRWGKKESVLKIREKVPDELNKRSDSNAYETATSSVPEKNTIDSTPIIAMTVIGIIGLIIYIVNLNPSNDINGSFSTTYVDSTSTMSMDTATTEPVTLESYNSSNQNLNAVSKYKGSQLKNGDSPFSSCFGKAKRRGPSWIIFENSNKSDAIVSLADYSDGKTVRNEYIRAGANFKMSNIPPGYYIIKTIYGNDWNPNIQSPCGSKGFFESDVNYSISDGDNSLLKIESTGLRYSTYTVTLYTVANGNLSQRTIDASQFFQQ